MSISDRPAARRLPVIDLGPRIRAEVHGIDRARLDDDRVTAIREALVRYRVL